MEKDLDSSGSNCNPPNMDEVMRMSSRVNNANRINNNNTHSIDISGSTEDIDDDVFEIDENLEHTESPSHVPAVSDNPPEIPEPMEPINRSPSPESQEILEIFNNSENALPTITIDVPEAEQSDDIPENAENQEVFSNDSL